MTDPATGMPTRSTLSQRLLNTSYLALHYRGQAKYPYKSLEQILADQSRRVQRTVEYACRHVPYYRETMQRLGLTPLDFRTANDLAKLPLLERGELQRDPEYFVSTAEPLTHYLQTRSSGTMGRPCTFFYDWRSLCLDAGHTGRAGAVIERVLGRSLGYRKTMILHPRGTASLQQEFYRDRLCLPGRLAIERQELSLLDPLQVNVPLINAFKPDVIHSFGSYLAALFEYVRSSGQAFHRPRLLLYTFDALPESARQMIADSFGVPAFSIYEAVEAHNIGFECEKHVGFHLNVDLCPLRIVDADGRNLPDGHSGNVVISNLVNRGTVLLNYRLGDIATRVSEHCPCGRVLPLLSHPEGRQDDWLERPSGQPVHPQAVVRIFKHVAHVWQWQVVQEAECRFRVLLVPAETCDRQQTQERIASELIRVFGQQASVNVCFVDSIPRTAGGKVRSVISMRAHAARELPSTTSAASTRGQANDRLSSTQLVGGGDAR